VKAPDELLWCGVSNAGDTSLGSASLAWRILLRAAHVLRGLADRLLSGPRSAEANDSRLRCSTESSNANALNRKRDTHVRKR